jgi:NADPH2:quinone reductase
LLSVRGIWSRISDSIPGSNSSGIFDNMLSNDQTPAMQQMRVLLVRSYDPFQAEIVLRDIPSPGPDALRIRVHAAGVSFVDALTARGQYQIKPELPYIPGSECAGVVEAVGAHVRNFRPGQRVCALSSNGVYAERLCVEAAAVAPLPASMSFAGGAIIRVAHGTALYALAQRGRLAAAERLLVLGAGGATGLAAIEIGKALGAYVIAAASSEAKRAACRNAGADAVVGSDPAGLRGALKDLLGDASLDVVFDPVGGPLTEAAFRCLGWNGRHLVIGFASGAITSLKANLALLKGSALVGVNLGQFVSREPEAAAANLARIMQLYEAGRLRPRIARILPLAQSLEAFDLAASGAASGRIVLEMCG